VRSIDFYSSPSVDTNGLVPVIITRDPYMVLCKQVRDAHQLHIKLKEASASEDLWSKCPVKFADFAKNCTAVSAQSWRYIASLWKALSPNPIPQRNA
jgi:hypothetical protein